MSLSRNVAYNIIINVLNVLIPIITVPYTSRVLGVENVGIVNFALTYATYFALFVNLGIPTYGVREVGKLRNDTEGRNRLVSELVGIMSCSSLIFSTLYVVSIFTIPTLRDEWLFLLISGVGMLFAPMNVDWYFQGRENLKIIALRSIVVKVLGLIGLFVFVRERQDVITLLVINVLIVSVSQVWNFFYMLHTEVKLWFGGLNFRRHLKPVLILFLSSLAISIYTLFDTLMLGFLSTYTEVGYYSSAIKISKLVLPIVTSAAIVAMPRISQLYKEQNYDELKRVSQRSFDFMSLLAPPLTMGLIVISPTFVPLFFGAEFMGVIPSMMIVSGVVFFIGLNNFYGPQVLISSGKDKEFMYAVLAGTACNFSLNFLLIPLWGAVGASIASVVAEGVVTGVVIIYACRTVSQIRPSYKTMMHAVVASLPMIAYGLLFGRLVDSDLWATMLIGGCSAVTFVVIELWVFKDGMAIDMANKILSRFGRSLEKQ